MKVIVNSLPKSGTHLLSRVVDLLGFKERRPGLNGSLLRKTARNPLRNYIKALRATRDNTLGFSVDLDIPTNILRRDWLHSHLAKIQHGEYLFGHLPYSAELNTFLQIHGFKILFIYRDPRDVLISLANYHRRGFKPFQTEFNRSSQRERWNIALNGISRGEIVLAPLADRLSRAYGWLNAPGVCRVKFEHLIGALGGGEQLSARNTIAEIMTFLDLEVSDKQMDLFANLVFYTKSKTFHRGRIGQWAEEMAEVDKHLMNTQIGNWIEAYGYTSASS